MSAPFGHHALGAAAGWMPPPGAAAVAAPGAAAGTLLAGEDSLQLQDEEAGGDEAGDQEHGTAGETRHEDLSWLCLCRAVTRAARDAGAPSVTMRPSRIFTTRSAMRADVRVVGDDEERAVLALREVAEELEDLRADGGVEVGGRLVGEEHRGPAGEGAGDRDALLLPAREVARQEAPAVDEVDRVERLLGLLARRPALHPLDVERVLDVLERGQGREEVELLEDEADRAFADRRQPARARRIDLLAVDHDPPGGRGEDAAEDRQEGRLAGARRPLEGDDLAGAQREVDAVQHRDLLASLAEGLGHLRWPRGRCARQPRGVG